MMKNDGDRTTRVAWTRMCLALTLALAALGPLQALAQMPARFYWKSLSGADAVPLIVNSVSGNTNPFDPAHSVQSTGNIDATLALVGYAHTFALVDRAATAAVILPMGRVSGEVTTAGKSFNQSANGFGDPMFEFDINVIGPTAQRSLRDAFRYEPGFAVDRVVDVAVPVGEYDSNQPLNLGQNRWYGRVGAPVVWQLGPWVPGRRTTLEFVPAVWVFGDNDDYVGQTLKTDPLYQLDAHLTRDFTEQFWGSIDASWYDGARATVNGVSGDKLNAIGVGLTLGYTLNDNLHLTAGYKSTINDNGPGDLRMDMFMVTLVYGWHPLVEGARRLKE